MPAYKEDHSHKFMQSGARRALQDISVASSQMVSAMLAMSRRFAPFLDEFDVKRAELAHRKWDEMEDNAIASLLNERRGATVELPEKGRVLDYTERVLINSGKGANELIASYMRVFETLSNRLAPEDADAVSAAGKALEFVYKEGAVSIKIATARILTAESGAELIDATEKAFKEFASTLNSVRGIVSMCNGITGRDVLAFVELLRENYSAPNESE
jgi:hypothetical protein